MADILSLSLDEIIRKGYLRNINVGKWRGRPRNVRNDRASLYVSSVTYGSRTSQGVKRLSNGYRFTAPLQPRLTIPKRGAINRRWTKTPFTRAFRSGRTYPTRQLYRPRALRASATQSYSSRKNVDPWGSFKKREKSVVRGLSSLQSRANEYGVPFRMRNGVIVQGLRSDNLDPPPKLSNGLPSLRSLIRNNRTSEVLKRSIRSTLRVNNNYKIQRSDDDYSDSASSPTLIIRREHSRRRKGLERVLGRQPLSPIRRSLRVSIDNNLGSRTRRKELLHRRQPSPVYSISSTDSSGEEDSIRSVSPSSIREKRSLRNALHSNTRHSKIPPVNVQKEIRYVPKIVPKIVTEKVPVHVLHHQVLDRKIQREIAALQGKIAPDSGFNSPLPLEVTGDGVKNLKLLPNATKLGLNRRFTGNGMAEEPVK